jgi:hypothetical protein
LVHAKAGYLPSLQGYAGYDVHNSILSQDVAVERHGWIVGAQVTWSIFDGLRTRGRVLETRANYERAGIELEDTARRIELEAASVCLVGVKDARRHHRRQAIGVLSTAEEVARFVHALNDRPFDAEMRTSGGGLQCRRIGDAGSECRSARGYGGCGADGRTVAGADSEGQKANQQTLRREHSYRTRGRFEIPPIWFLLRPACA